MQTTRFKVWLKSGMQPVWPGIKFVRPPEYITDDAVDVTVESDGRDLRSFIYDYGDMFAGYVQLRPEGETRNNPKPIMGGPRRFRNSAGSLKRQMSSGRTRAI